MTIDQNPPLPQGRPNQRARSRPAGLQFGNEFRAKHPNVTLKEMILGLMNEREYRYEQRMDAIERAISNSERAHKDAIEAARLSVREALAVTAQAAAIATAATEKRFEGVNEFRAQLADQQDTFARKIDIDNAMQSSEKAILKAEAATEKRFESVNEFRAQLSDQQVTLVRKSEVDIRFGAIEDKLATALATIQTTKGRDMGFGTAAAIAASMIGLLVGLASIVIAIINRH